MQRHSTWIDKQSSRYSTAQTHTAVAEQALVQLHGTELGSGVCAGGGGSGGGGGAPPTIDNAQAGAALHLQHGAIGSTHSSKWPACCCLETVRPRRPAGKRVSVPCNSWLPGARLEIVRVVAMPQG